MSFDPSEFIRRSEGISYEARRERTRGTPWDATLRPGPEQDDVFDVLADSADSLVNIVGVLWVICFVALGLLHSCT